MARPRGPNYVPHRPRVHAPPTQEQINEICDQLELGHRRAEAAAAAGTTGTVLKRWLQQGMADVEGNQLTTYAELYIRVVRTEADDAVALIAAIRRAAARTWQAAAWLLERRYLWVKPEAGKDEDVKQQEISVDEVMSRIVEGDKAAAEAEAAAEAAAEEAGETEAQEPDETDETEPPAPASEEPEVNLSLYTPPPIRKPRPPRLGEEV